MPATGTVRVKGLRELNRAFAKMSRDLKKDLTSELKAVGEPVRSTAELLASSEIRNIGQAWSRMRVGATTKVVYVAPKSRRHGGSPRPNLAGLLMDRAMQPALDQNQPAVIARLEHVIDHIADDVGF